MRISGIERYDIRQVMGNARGDFRSVHVLHATLTDCTVCGYDPMSDSGDDPTCSECEGTGKTISWLAREIPSRIKVFDFVQLQGAGAVPPGVELGDVALYVRKNDRETFETLEGKQHSYVKIAGDGNAYQPFSITADGVGQDDEIRVLLRKVSVEQRVTGY